MEAAKLSSIGIWQKALDTLRSTRRQTLIIMAAGLVLPQLIVDVVFDGLASGKAAEMRALFEANAGKDVPFWVMIEPMLAFAGPYFAVSFLVVLLMIGAYFALVELAVAHMRGGEVPSAGQAWVRGMLGAIRRLPGLFLAIFLLSFFGQVFVAPAILAAVFWLVTPVITVAEGKGALRAAGEAVTLRYARRTPFSVWAVGFNLLSLAATLYCAFVLITQGVLQLLALDEHVPSLRAAWAMRFGDLAFGPLYAVGSFVEEILLAGTLTFLPALTAALYFTVASRRVIARA